MTELDCDVLVVGYGPVGQMLTILLARQGHRVTVLERQERPYPRPRAVHFDDEIARVFAASGLAEATAAISQPSGEYDWRNADGRTLLHFDWGAAGPSGWPEANMFSQPQLESVLAAKADSFPNVDVRRGGEAVALTDHGDHVETRARFPGGEAGEAGERHERSVRARYVVGCDGANSFVREQLGTGLTDLGFFYDWLILDVIPHEQREWKPFNLQICDPRRPTTVVSGGPGRRRWEFMRLPGETIDELNTEQTAWRLLAPWDLTPDNADLERHTLAGELVLGLPDEADLGNAVDPDRLRLVRGVHRLAAGMVRGQPALLHGRGSQRREPDHVADGVDVRDLGLEVLIHRDPAALVGTQAGRGQVQRVGLALPPGGVHDRVGRDALAAGQQGDRPAGMRLDGRDPLAEAEGDGQVAQVVLERLDHLDVAELQHPVALLHHRDLGAKRGEHGHVLDPDHARARDHHRAGHLLQMDDPVRVDHGAVVELDAGRAGGPGAGGDHDRLRAGPADPAVPVVDFDRVRVGETGRAAQDRDPVAGQLAAHHVHFAADHVTGAGGQVGHGDVVLDPVA